MYLQIKLLNASHTDGFSACFFCRGYAVFPSSPVGSLEAMLKDLKGIIVYLLWDVWPLYLFCCLETAASFYTRFKVSHLLCRLFVFNDQCFYMKLKFFSLFLFFFYFFGKKHFGKHFTSHGKGNSMQRKNDKIIWIDCTQFERSLWPFNSHN